MQTYVLSIALSDGPVTEAFTANTLWAAAMCATFKYGPKCLVSFVGLKQE